MKRVALPLLLAAAFVAIAMAGWWLKRPAEAVAVACADPVAGCRFLHRGAAATLRFSATPAPMEAFRVELEAPDARRASAEFQMVGMDMGFNRYDLKPAGSGVFVAQATLPVCVSGRRDWTLFLDLDGTRYALPFSTR
ncbi:MAG: hypothetical protein ACLGG2_04020 [Gammaproteobacteria bacterium]